MTAATDNDCQDCGDTPEEGGFERRTRCAYCDLLVCPWCLHHVHGRNHRKAKQEKAES